MAKPSKDVSSPHYSVTDQIFLLSSMGRKGKLYSHQVSKKITKPGIASGSEWEVREVFLWPWPQPIGAEDKTLQRKGNCKRHWAVIEGGVEVWEHTESCGLELVGKEDQGEEMWPRATLRVQRSQHSSVHITPRPYAKSTMTWFTKENDLSGCLAENASVQEWKQDELGDYVR